MSRSWTENQKKAISARGEQVLVSAAAGSGKTAVLTERVKNILCDTLNPCSSSQLLVVTFTKAAAGEMRDRIAKALKEEIKKNFENRKYLKNQLALLPAADICTIDSFCAKIVRENFHIAGISSDFSVIDDNDHNVLKNESITEVLNELYDNEDASFNALKSFFMSERDDKQLESIIIKLYEFSRSYPSPKKWLNEIVEYFNPENDINNTVFAKEAYKYFELMLEYYILVLDEMKSALIDDINEENDFTALVGNNITNLTTLLFDCQEERWDDFIEHINSAPVAKYPRAPRGSYYSLTNSIMGECKECIDEILEKTLPTTAENKEDCVVLYPIVKKLVEAVNMFSKKLEEKKTELNSFSFDDILHKCIDLLVVFRDDGTPEKTELAKELTDKYKEILIDEYQDTNEAQNILFEIVSRDKKNFYCVGDVKQSIYRFRLASPELFMKLKDKLPLCEDKFSGASQIILEKNFRSRKGVTECVNYIFSKLMTKEVGEIKYDEKEYLYCGASYPETSYGEVHLHVLDAISLKSDELALKEAEYIAKYIKETVEKGIMVKGENDSLRPAKYDDFCILLRSPKKKVDVLSQALSEQGISSVFENNEVNVTSKEVMLLVSLIKAVSNPLIDVPLISVMLSPLFGFTSDELAEIRLINKKSDIYTCLLEYAKTNIKAEKFIRKLDFYRNISSSYPIYDFVKLLVDDTAITEVFLSTENGNERYSAIQSVLKCAENFTSNGRYGLSGFIRYLDSVIDNKALTKSDATISGGVKIMSIHKSKGLEFPFVILADCAKNFNLSDSYGSLTVSREVGLGLKIRDDEKFTRFGTLSSFAGEKAIKHGDISEELRILYVALTRAKEHLIFICSVTSKASKTRIARSLYMNDENNNKYLHPFEVYKAKNLTEWICSAMLYHKDSKELREYLEVQAVQLIDSDFNLKVVINDVNNSEETETESVEVLNKGTVDFELLNTIKERAEYVYPYDDLSVVLAKINASSVENHIAQKSFFATKKPKFVEEALTGAQKGTVVHKFLELCDFKNANDNLQDELNRLLAEYKLTEDEISAIDIDQIKTFFNNDVTKRLLNSETVYKEYQFSVMKNAGDFYNDLPDNMKNEKIVVQGKFDCAFLESDGAVLIDYKTDKISDEETLVSIYKGQLSIYKSALEECAGVLVKEVYLYSFKLGKFIEVIL